MDRREFLKLGLMAGVRPITPKKDQKRLIAESVCHVMAYIDTKKITWPLSYLKETGLKYKQGTIPLYEKNRNFQEVVRAFLAEPVVANSINIYIEDTRFNYFNIVTVTANNPVNLDRYWKHIRQISGGKSIIIEMEKGGKCKEEHRG